MALSIVRFSFIVFISFLLCVSLSTSTKIFPFLSFLYIRDLILALQQWLYLQQKGTVYTRVFHHLFLLLIEILAINKSEENPVVVIISSEVLFLSDSRI